MGGRGKNSNTYYLHEGKQGKHLPGHNNFVLGKSPITISETRLKELFSQYRGTGQRNGNRETVNFFEVIGQARNPNTGLMEDTTWGKIHYSDDGGWHIVPVWEG